MRRASSWCALSLTLLTGVARAEDTDELQSLLNESVVTTASTQAQRGSAAPGTAVTITSDDLRRYGIRTIAQAIDFLSVGLVTSDPLRTPDVGARGVMLPNDDGKHFLLLVNGHAINDPLYGAARFDEGAGIPMDLVDHLEVVVGPGSVLYGSNAMLGVVNVITKAGGDYSGVHVGGDYEFGRSVRAYSGAGATFELFGKPAELTAGAEYYSRFGPDLSFSRLEFPVNQGTGRPYTFRRGQPGDGVWGGDATRSYFTEAPSGFLRVRVGSFDVSLFGSVYRRGIPYATPGMNVDFDDPDSFEMDRAIRLDVKHQATLTSVVELTSRLYADSFDYQKRVNRNAAEGCFVGGFTTCSYYDAARARWVGIEERVSLNWLSNSTFVTLVGIDLRSRWVGTKQDAVDLDTGRPFAPTAGIISDSALLVSPYVQQTASPTKWLDLNAGARLDADARFSPILSPRGAVAVRPFEKTTVKAVYSQAFRAPTWVEQDSANYRLAPSQSIEPEKVHSVEGSVEQRFGTHRILWGAFYTWWDNLIELVPVDNAELAALQAQNVMPITASNVSQFRNVSSISNVGWNANWDGTLAEGRLSYGVSATEAFTRRKVASGSAPLTVAPQLFGNVHVAYDFGGFIPSPGLAAHYLGRRPRDLAFSLPVYAGLPDAPAMVDFRATLTGKVPALRGLGYQLSVAYATTAESAYVAGPAPAGLPLLPGSSVPFAPVDQLRAFVSLRYDFGGASNSDGASP